MIRAKYEKGFTLIELLIVVAIIAILAAIAVPNFLEAQTRAKVARTMADMRSMATALESYHVDSNTYIQQIPQYRAQRINLNQPLVLENLTTPIAYLNSVSSFRDPFEPKTIYIGQALENNKPGPGPGASQMERDAFKLYTYYARNAEKASLSTRKGDPKPLWYIIGSAGPDGAVDNLNDPLTAQTDDNETARAFFSDYTMYDASNGTISRGGLYRVGGVPTGSGKAFYYIAQMAMN